MRYIADLHIHSRFSRATSPDLNFVTLYETALLKGIQVIGTGDFTHPGWLKEIQECLEPAPESGLFQLKPDLAKKIQSPIPAPHNVRFLLSVEISSIYKKHNKVRKIHNIVFAPNLESAEKIVQRLSKIGNLKSDGRPILGLDSHNLLEILLEISPECYLIPAHIWTPWFALFGSNSGFDHIEECFGDLTQHIFALETGLSSDPSMNWLCSQLDRFVLVSNSDAHSASKLGREANLFDTELSYQGLFSALKNGDPQKFLGTIEFYPEEGKYHLDGHRKCNQRLTPEQTRLHHGVCPVCQKPLTIGVMYRVMELADRLPGQKPARTFPFSSLVPLESVLAEILEVGESTKKVQTEYHDLITRIGPELAILNSISLPELEKKGTPILAEAIRRVRQGQIQIQAGYDGEYGTIRIFKPGEKQQFENQDSFMGWNTVDPSSENKDSNNSPQWQDVNPMTKSAQSQTEQTQSKVDKFSAAPNLSPQTEQTQSKVDKFSAAPNLSPQTQIAEPKKKGTDKLATTLQPPSLDSPNTPADKLTLNTKQQEATLHTGNPILVIAGPGTGKTRTLIYRIVYAIEQNRVKPEQVLAITFTNKASQEMQERLQNILPHVVEKISICTFHRLGWQIIQEQHQILGLPQDCVIIEDFQKEQLCSVHPNLRKALSKIEEIKNGLLNPEDIQHEPFFAQFQEYQNVLQQYHGIDLEDLLYIPIKLFQQYPQILATYQERFQFIAVDEYQDLNLAQYTLLKLLVTPQTDFLAIGDPDQAIYGFRGAQSLYFRQFQQDFSSAKIIYLQQNYRSTQEIIQPAKCVIAHNTLHIPYNLQAENSGPRIQLCKVATGKSEAEFIVKTIDQLLGGISNFSLASGRSDGRSANINYGFQSFAILYRTNAQTQDLEEAFTRSGMPYQLITGQSFWQKPRMQTWFALLQTLAYPHRDLPISYMLSQLNGIGKHNLSVIQQYAQEKTVSIFSAISQEIPNLSSSSAQVILNFSLQLEHWRQSLTNAQNLKAWIQLLLQHNEYYDNNLSCLHLNTNDQETFLLMAEGFSKLDQFLSYIALQKNNDDYNPKADKITFMTLHTAKGLEFPVVFIVGCEEGILPFLRYNHTLEHIEEERRLFYVGMTRAKERLYLLHATERVLLGKICNNLPSRFLGEIPFKYCEIVENFHSPKKNKENIEEQQFHLF